LRILLPAYLPMYAYVSASLCVWLKVPLIALLFQWQAYTCTYTVRTPPLPGLQRASPISFAGLSGFVTIFIWELSSVSLVFMLN